uniref:Uncharacterized protein n=1 Tax=Prolemur simus TaxID=1328070 RepID=A0A8C9DL76_PROSS
VCVYYIFKLGRNVFAPKVGYMICLCVSRKWMTEGLFFLPCLFVPEPSIVYIHFSLSAIFRSFKFVSLTFLVWIRLKYKIHL